MGSWAAGLYSSDFAMDLRSTIGAISRLPFDGDRLVEILCESESAAADNPNNEEHATFWLVTADQFARRGIVSERAHEKALEIIDSGRDIAMLSKLGMKPRELGKRQKTLAELRSRLTADSQVARRGKVLKKPQAFLMEMGEVFVYPTSGGECIHSYFPSKERIRAGARTVGVP